MRTPIAVLTALVALLGAIAPPPTIANAGDAVVVSAAASLKRAFEEIGALSAASAGGPGAAFNFGASGDLIAQIQGGAPADVFAAAAAKDMDDLEAEGALLPGTRIDFATNQLVLVIPSTSALGVSSFTDLSKPQVARIAIVNPKTGPAGRYAGEVLASVGIADIIQPKLVLAENVRQALDYAARGEVDAAVVYATDAALRPREVKIAAIAPPGSHKPVVYPIAILKGSTHREAAKAFLATVCSENGQAILARHGFGRAPGVR